MNWYAALVAFALPAISVTRVAAMVPRKLPSASNPAGDPGNVEVAVSEPTWIVPLNSRTMRFARTLPDMLGVASLVMLSVELAPLSLAASRSGAAIGAAGAIVSIVTLNPADAALTLPARSS